MVKYGVYKVKKAGKRQDRTGFTDAVERIWNYSEAVQVSVAERHQTFHKSDDLESWGEMWVDIRRIRKIGVQKLLGTGALPHGIRAPTGCYGNSQEPPVDIPH